MRETHSRMHLAKLISEFAVWEVARWIYLHFGFFGDKSWLRSFRRMSVSDRFREIGRECVFLKEMGFEETLPLI